MPPNRSNRTYERWHTQCYTACHVELPDALIAAAAEAAGIGVLHYDHHYDRLAEVLDFDSRWIAAPGAL